MQKTCSKAIKNYLAIFLSFLLIMTLTSACSSKPKVSSLIVEAVNSADEALKPTIDEKHKATAEEIEKIRKAEKLVREVADTYKFVTRADNAGPFEDMANALSSKAEYLETGNKDAYNTFNKLYNTSKTELLKFSDELKAKGL